MTKEKKIDLSIIITAHHEGLIAHKTMLSVFAAAEEIKKGGFSYEIVIHMDNSDKTTKKYFERYRNDKNIRLFYNSFGDTGPSRNYATKAALGEYITFLDGDDIISKNWYINGIRTLNDSTTPTVVCPEAILTFGDSIKNVLTIQKNSQSKEQDTIILIGENCWSSVIMTKKEILLENPYLRLDGEYAHEDYLLNCTLVNSGITFKVAHDTVLFYRRTPDSRLSTSNSECRTIPYTPLFDFQYVKHLNSKLTKYEDRKTWIRENGRRIYKRIRGNDGLNFFITPCTKLVKKVLRQKTPPKIPGFVIDAWKEANTIDSQLYPYEYLVSQTTNFSAKCHLSVGKAYCELAKLVRHTPDYIFIVPWIVRGGADKVLFNYIKAMQEKKPTQKITIISTLPVTNLWATKLPDNVDYLDFGNLADGLSPYDRDILFSRLIIQLQCKKLHIINSEFAYKWIKKHQFLISGQHYTINVSYFSYEYIKDSNFKAVYSYDNPCLFDIYPVVNRVFTDNSAIIDYAVNRNAFDREKFIVHYQPVTEDIIPYREHKIQKPLQILWASRIVNVKLPYILAEIGKRLDPREFKINVYGEFGSEVSKNIFKDSPAIKYCGEFDGFSSLPIDEIDLFLYTSMNDGIPNILLEAIASGLPIIASNDGGVKEVIRDHKTGLLVNNPINVDEYVSAIHEAAAHPQDLPLYVQNAQKLVKKQHSWKKFAENVTNDFQ